MVLLISTPNGRNDINNTNQLKSEIINDISFSAFDVLSVKGLKIL